jgi:hypothetical protein
MGTYILENMVTQYGHIRTEEYNGRKCSKGRQTLEVVEAVLVPANWPGNKQIAAQAIVQGKRGAMYNAYIYKNGFISVI